MAVKNRKEKKIYYTATALIFKNKKKNESLKVIP